VALSLVMLFADAPPPAISAPEEDAEVEEEEEIVEALADDEAGGGGTRHRGEEGKMGAPKSKSGLYAMKGPREAAILEVMRADSGHFLASPYGGAFAVGTDDADVWGGLVGTEVGESYGVGGLGLVGTGRGGGGAGEGFGASAGKSGRRGGERAGSYDAGLQPMTLTVGTVDDNADLAGFQEALRGRFALPSGLPEMSPLAPRHVDAPRALDIALVIDTTGSMGDELEYLKVELREIAREVEAEFPGVDQRWALIAYRDEGDDYVTRSFDFSPGIGRFSKALGAQSAGGGGDYPEAMDKALAASSQLSWRKGQETSRVVFLVADAPAHAESSGRFGAAVREHRRDRTAIYSVAGSGVGGEAEAQLRVAAKVTGGQYIFLTDHSGVGGHHEAPKVAQYSVESLHEAMTRMIRGELGGGFARKKGAPLVEVRSEPELVEEPAPQPFDVVAPARAFEDEECCEALEPAPVERSLWEELWLRLMAHLVFAGAAGLLFLAGIGADTLLRRRRA
jgi:hypothetical protein